MPGITPTQAQERRARTNTTKATQAMDPVEAQMDGHAGDGTGFSATVADVAVFDDELIDEEAGVTATAARLAGNVDPDRYRHAIDTRHEHDPEVGGLAEVTGRLRSEFVPEDPERVLDGVQAHFDLSLDKRNELLLEATFQAEKADAEDDPSKRDVALALRDVIETEFGIDPTEIDYALEKTQVIPGPHDRTASMQEEIEADADELQRISADAQRVEAINASQREEVRTSLNKPVDDEQLDGMVEDIEYTRAQSHREEVIETWTGQPVCLGVSSESFGGSIDDVRYEYPMPPVVAGRPDLFHMPLAGEPKTEDVERRLVDEYGPGTLGELRQQAERLVERFDNMPFSAAVLTRLMAKRVLEGASVNMAFFGVMDLIRTHESIVQPFDLIDPSAHDDDADYGGVGVTVRVERLYGRKKELDSSIHQVARVVDESEGGTGATGKLTIFAESMHGFRHRFYLREGDVIRVTNAGVGEFRNQLSLVVHSRTEIDWLERGDGPAVAGTNRRIPREFGLFNTDQSVNGDDEAGPSKNPSAVTPPTNAGSHEIITFRSQRVRPVINGEEIERAMQSRYAAVNLLSSEIIFPSVSWIRDGYAEQEWVEKRPVESG